MATEVRVCNRALASIGDTVIITSLTQDIKSAIYCNLYYSVIRDALLALYPWKFALKQSTLSSTTAPTYDFTYAHLLPSDFITYISKTSIENRYKIEGATILNNSATITITYIAQITDVTLFNPLFKLALEHLLAMRLAVPLADSVISPVLVNTLDKAFRVVIYNAYKSGAIESGSLDALDENLEDIDFLPKTQVQKGDKMLVSEV